MACTSSLRSALLVAASALTLSNAHLEYTIRVRNLTFQQPFSRIFFIAHTNDISIFKEGTPASDALKALAQFGDASGLEALVVDPEVAPYVCGYVVGSAPQFPGTTERYTLEVDDSICEGRSVISMASMVGNTNDGFVGFDSERLKSRGSSTITPPVWDSGTEDNNELCSHVPGPACDTTSGNEEAGPGEGYVFTHRGMHGVGGIDEATYTWLNPAAEVFIAKPVEL